MLDIRLTFEGKTIPNLTQEWRVVAERTVTKAVFDIEAKGKKNAPHVTGNLRGSIRAIPPGMARGGTPSEGAIEGEVVVGADYGIYQEEGWTDSVGGNHAGKFYMLRAKDEVEPSFVAQMEKVIAGLW